MKGSHFSEIRGEGREITGSSRSRLCSFLCESWVVMFNNHSILRIKRPSYCSWFHVFTRLFFKCVYTQRRCDPDVQKTNNFISYLKNILSWTGSQLGKTTLDLRGRPYKVEGKWEIGLHARSEGSVLPLLRACDRFPFVHVLSSTYYTGCAKLGGPVGH